MLTEIEQYEAAYNARDVLGMCRVFPLLVAGLEQTNTVGVYEYDEQLAYLALQMTRVGLPVNSELRAEIGARLRALRDAAIEELRPYTEEPYREEFLNWVAAFFAVKARKGEPTAGVVRVGPTRAAQEYEEARTTLANWKAYRKQLTVDGSENEMYLDREITLGVDTDEQIAAFTEIVKEKKTALAVAQFVFDEEDELAHTEETAYAVRHAIRKAQAIMALEKKGVNFGAKVQQCAILRAAGVPLHRKTEKTGLPKIDKEILEGLARHKAAKALLSYILTEKTINVYIEGEKRAGKNGGKAKPVMVTEDGYIHPLWGVHRITGRWNSSPNCFDGKTELYVRSIEETFFGCHSSQWLSIANFVKNWEKFEVAQYNPDMGLLEWVKPTNAFRRYYTGQMISLQHTQIDLCATKDHRIPTCSDLMYAGNTSLNGFRYQQASLVCLRDLQAGNIAEHVQVALNAKALDDKNTCNMIAINHSITTGVQYLDPVPIEDLEITKLDWSGWVYCLSVPSSYVIVKRNDKTCIAGQCQNWSKRAGGGAENLRSMIEAPEGYILIGADQKQLEARLIAAMSGCKYMLDTFRQGEDIHSAFALIGFPDEWPRLAAIFKDHKKGGKCTCNDCNLRNQMRDRTKNLEYGAFYGGQEQKLFEAIVKDFPEATPGQVREFLRRFNAMLPEVLTWRNAVLAEAIRMGEIRSPILGRRQVFPLGRVDPNVAFNYKAQSGGADIWAIGAVKFMKLWNQEEFDARLIQNGHDSVLILVREELAAQVEQDVYKCWNMEWGGVPFEMESKIAKQWSET